MHVATTPNTAKGRSPCRSGRAQNLEQGEEPKGTAEPSEAKGARLSLSPSRRSLILNSEQLLRRKKERSRTTSLRLPSVKGKNVWPRAKSDVRLFKKDGTNRQAKRRGCAVITHVKKKSSSKLVGRTSSPGKEEEKDEWMGNSFIPQAISMGPIKRKRRITRAAVGENKRDEAIY